jgi:CheY-like chemotaxis protein
VITDINMPRKNGLEVVRALQASQAPVKVIVMSGGGRSGAGNELDAALLLGANRVITKPFTCESLLAVVNDVLPDGLAAALAS